MGNNKQSNKRTYGGNTGRGKPVVPKAGVTRNPKRRYGCGGKLK